MNLAMGNTYAIGGRNASVEVLRCLLMFMMVLNHAYCHGVYQAATGWWRIMFDGLIVWHVDCFVAISGWYGLRFSWKRLMSLLALITFYSVVGAAIEFATNPNYSMFNVRVDGGWFGHAYLVLIALAPIVNAAIDGLRARQLVMCWSVITVFVFCTWFPVIGRSGILLQGINNWNFTALVYVFLTVRVFRKACDRQFNVGELCAYMICYVIFVVASFSAGLTNRLANYNYAPHVIVMAIAVFLLFVKHYTSPAIVARAGSFLAPSVFAVYLIHDVVPAGKWLYRFPQEILGVHLGLGAALVIPVSAVIAFIACLMIDLVRRLLYAPIRGPAMSILERIDTAWRAIYES